MIESTVKLIYSEKNTLASRKITVFLCLSGILCTVRIRDNLSSTPFAYEYVRGLYVVLYVSCNFNIKNHVFAKKTRRASPPFGC